MAGRLACASLLRSSGSFLSRAHVARHQCTPMGCALESGHTSPSLAKRSCPLPWQQCVGTHICVCRLFAHMIAVCSSSSMDHIVVIEQARKSAMLNAYTPWHPSAEQHLLARR